MSVLVKALGEIAKEAGKAATCSAATKIGEALGEVVAMRISPPKEKDPK